MELQDTPREDVTQLNQAANGTAPVDNTSEPEMVEVHEASREDLDAAMKDLLAQEKAAMQPPQEPVAQQSAPQQTPASNQTVAPRTPIPGKEAGAEATTSQRAYSQEEVQAILANQDKQKRQLDEKELFIQRQGNELGKLRSEYANTRTQLSALRAQLANGLEERFSENPLQASNDRDRIREIDQAVATLDQNESRADNIVKAQTFFLKHVDTNQVSPDDIAELLRNVDGLPENAVAQFKANPWEWAPPEALVQMGKRAMEMKNAVQADADRRLLAKHVLAQNAEIERLKGRPAQLVNTLQRNINQPPPVTSASTVSARSSMELDPTRMSRKELDDALKHAMAQG